MKSQAQIRSQLTRNPPKDVEVIRVIDDDDNEMNRAICFDDEEGDLMELLGGSESR